MKKINYLETFIFPDIDQVYPVYAISESGKILNFKSIIYPSPTSKKKFTRKKQLANRSLQAKIFDALIEVGFFEPLNVIKEFPIVIQNSLRLPKQEGLYLLLDYYFPELRLAIELDSEYHNTEKDQLRDEYLQRLGIKTWRLNGLHKQTVQRKEFRELTKFMREQGTLTPLQFDFMRDLKDKLAREGKISQ